jgi:hypothetical protein
MFEYFRIRTRKGKLTNSEKIISLLFTRTIWRHSFAEYVLCHFEEFRKVCAFILYETETVVCFSICVIQLYCAEFLKHWPSNSDCNKMTFSPSQTFFDYKEYQWQCYGSKFSCWQMHMAEYIIIIWRCYVIIITKVLPKILQYRQLSFGS